MSAGDRPMGDSGPSTMRPASDIHVTSFFEAVKALRGAEDEESRPLGKGDPLLAARIKELKGYVDVFLKAEAPRRPRFNVTERKADPGSAVSVEASFTDAVQLYEALTLSLSKGGVFIKTEALLPIDALLDVTCKLEREDIAFKVAAKVIWINPRESQGRPAGMGLKLYKLSSVQRQVVTDFMNGDLPPAALTHLSE